MNKRERFDCWRSGLSGPALANFGLAFSVVDDLTAEVARLRAENKELQARLIDMSVITGEMGR